MDEICGFCLEGAGVNDIQQILRHVLEKIFFLSKEKLHEENDNLASKVQISCNKIFIDIKFI
jgi:hypothetical protein